MRNKNIDRRLGRLEGELTPDEEDVLRIEVECIGQPELNTVIEVRSPKFQGREPRQDEGERSSQQA